MMEASAGKNAVALAVIIIWIFHIWRIDLMMI